MGDAVEGGELVGASGHVGATGQHTLQPGQSQAGQISRARQRHDGQIIHAVVARERAEQDFIADHQMIIACAAAQRFVEARTEQRVGIGRSDNRFHARDSVPRRIAAA